MKIKHDHALSMKHGHNICMNFFYPKQLKKIKPGNLEVINLVFHILWLLNSVLNHADIIRSHKCKTEARDDHALTMQHGQYVS